MSETSPSIIKTSKRFVLKKIAQHIAVAFAIFAFMYLTMVAPNVSSVNDEEAFLLYIPAVSLAFTYSLLALPFILKALIQSYRQGVEVNSSHLTVSTGVFSLSRETIPLAKVNHLSTHSSLLDQLFGLASVHIGTDTSSTVIEGIDADEARQLSIQVKHPSAQTIDV